eukprot:6133067-Pyramimonas_sp.AAC.1
MGLLPGDTESQDGFDYVPGLLCVREWPQEDARLPKQKHHDDQERPGFAGFHGEAVGVYDSLTGPVLFGAVGRATEDVLQPCHSRVLPVPAAVLSRSAPSLGNLPEEPLGGTLASPPERYPPPFDARQRWKGVVVDC